MFRSGPLVFATVLAILLVNLNVANMSPIVPKSDKDVIVDVSPFFKMLLRREPSGTVLDIDVLSGLVKVGYDRQQGRKPNVDVQVFGIGTTRNNRPTYVPDATPDAETVKYV